MKRLLFLIYETQMKMSKFDKMVLKILSGKSDNTLSLKELKAFLIKLGFEEREAAGSHTIYKKIRYTRSYKCSI